MLHKKVGFETDLNLYFLYHYFVCMHMLVSCLKQINEILVNLQTIVNYVLQVSFVVSVKIQYCFVSQLTLIPRMVTTF